LFGAYVTTVQPQPSTVNRWRVVFLDLVLHRALPDLQRMKLCYSAAASSASRSVFSWCD
jgi:hypothetical protein